jgi:DNA polymerase III delta prime subunit
METRSLWVEKYRPQTAADYVWRDEQQQQQVLRWIETANIPHLLLSGSAGVGKTTMARMLINELNIDELDVLHINASRDNNVETVRNRIEGFVSTMPFGEFKIVLLDEADYLTPNAQAILRGLMESAHNTARFILTCNYPNKIIPALHSRCQGFHIEKLDSTEFTARAATILLTENVEFDLDTLDTYVKAAFPDLRKCINSLQMHSVDGKLQTPDSNSSNTQDWKIQAVELFKENRIRDARKLICSNATTDDIDGIFRWMYDNLDLFSRDEQGQDRAIVIIRNGLVNHSMAADAEINLSATMIELSEIDDA